MLRFDYLGWQHDARGDITLALVRQRRVEPDALLKGEQAEGSNEPLPKVGRVQDSEGPEYKIQEVCPVENLQK